MSGRRTFGRTLLSIGVIVVAALAADPLMDLSQRVTYERRLGIPGLISALKLRGSRALPSRVAGGFPHFPLESTRRTAAPPSHRAQLALAAIAARAARDADLAPTTANLHGLGVAHLALGDPDQASAALEKALASSTGKRTVSDGIDRATDASLLSDLAAAYIERGIREDRMELVLTAIDATTQALALQSDLAAASFNRSLAIEQIHTRAQASAAWRAYLRHDDTSPWAAEARERLARLQKRALLSRQSTLSPPLSPEKRIARIEADLLPSWAEAQQAGDAQGVDRILDQAETVAKSLASCCERRFHEGVVAAARSASRGPRALGLALSAGHLEYRAARDQYARNNTTEALRSFAASRRAFRSSGSPFALMASKYVAASHYYLGDFDRALNEARGALDECARLPHCDSATAAHLHWVSALAAGATDPHTHLRHAAQALRGFEQHHELENAASIKALLAEKLQYLGASDEAWKYRSSALRHSEESGALDRLYLAFGEAAVAALEQGHFFSALMFQDVLIDSARRDQNTVYLADALLWRAQARATVATDLARQDFEEVDRLAASMGDARRRALFIANLSAARARVEAPELAVQLLGTALRHFEATGNRYRMAELYAARSLAAARASLDDVAEEDARLAIRELESARGTLTDAALRERYFNRSSEVFDNVIFYLWRRGHYDEAFALAEQSRARELYGAAPAPAVTTYEIRSALPQDAALLEYAVLHDRLLAWVIRPDGVVPLEIATSAQSIEDAVEVLHANFDREAEVNKWLTWLAFRLYRPAEIALRGARRLVIVPNKGLRGVPFAALRRMPEGRYLVEDKEIVLASSAASFVAARRRATERESVPTRQLVASYTAGNKSRNLPPLDAAQGELVGLREIYPRAEWLSEESATPNHVMTLAKQAEVIHITAHSVPNATSPRFASLALAAAEKGPDLYAHAIADSTLPVTRLVFLSTCGSPGIAPHNSAPLTIAESFVAAGVPLVVSSLRPVDDTTTAAFAVDFHRQLVQRGDPVAALRSTQIRALASVDRRHPRHWAAWMALGGS
jgi:CHAT domain-containing protein